MDGPIEFNSQILFSAVEIDDIRADAVLSFKLASMKQSVSQSPPQSGLSGCLLLPQGSPKVFQPGLAMYVLLRSVFRHTLPRAVFAIATIASVGWQRAQPPIRHGSEDLAPKHPFKSSLLARRETEGGCSEVNDGFSVRNRRYGRSTSPRLSASKGEGQGEGDPRKLQPSIHRLITASSKFMMVLATRVRAATWTWSSCSSRGYSPTFSNANAPC